MTEVKLQSGEQSYVVMKPCLSFTYTWKFIIQKIFPIIIFILTIILQLGCKDKIVSPKISTWTQCQGLPNQDITGFVQSGNNFLCGAYCATCSEAFIYISHDDGINWLLDTVFDVYSKSSVTPLYVGTPVTFLTYGGYVFAGIKGGLRRGTIYRSSDNGVTWSSSGISWPEADSEDVNCFTYLGNNIFAGGAGIFLSTDDGISWTTSNNGLPTLTYGSHSYTPSVSNMAGTGF